MFKRLTDWLLPTPSLQDEYIKLLKKHMDLYQRHNQLLHDSANIIKSMTSSPKDRVAALRKALNTVQSW